MIATQRRFQVLTLNFCGRRFLAAACALLVFGFIAARPVRAQSTSPITGTAGFETGLQLIVSGIGTPTDSGDTNTCTNSTQSCVTVSWGDDGSSSMGLIQTRNNGASYDVYGTHLYAQPGTYKVQISYNYAPCVQFFLGICTKSESVPVTLQTTATITAPSKFVILSIGDSVASGEGNPNEPNDVGTNYPSWSFWDDAYSSGDDPGYVINLGGTVPCNIVGFTSGKCSDPSDPNGCSIIDFLSGKCTQPNIVLSQFPPDEYSEWPNQSFPCHRSSYAGPSQAGNALIADNPSSGITFIHFACSGAAIEAGDTAANWVQDAVGQLKIARARLAPYGSSIGILLISAGSNDIYGPGTFENGFGGLVHYCLGASPHCDDNSGVQQSLTQSFNDLPTYYKNLDMEINCEQPPSFTGAKGVIQDPAPGCTDPQKDIPKLVLFTEYMDPTHDAGGSYPSGLGGRAECGPAFQKLDYTSSNYPYGDFGFLHDRVVVPLDSEVDSVSSYAQQAGLGVPTYAVSGIAADFLDHGVCAGSERWVNSGNDSQFLLGNGPPPDGSYSGQDSGTGPQALALCSALGLGTPCDTEELNGMLHPNSSVLAATLGNPFNVPPSCDNGTCGQEDYRLRILDRINQLNPPVTTATATAGGESYTFGAPTDEPVTVRLAASNPISTAGVGKIYYAVDNHQCGTSFAVNSNLGDVPGCSVYTGPFTISSPGQHTLTFFSVNSAGYPILGPSSIPPNTPGAIPYTTPPLEGILQAVQVSISPLQLSGSGVNLVTLLSSLTFDSDTNQYLAVVNIKNSGSVTATGLTVTGALDGANAVSVVPAGVSSLSMGTSFSVTLAFPSSVGAHGGRGVLTIHEDYGGGTAGGGFLVTFP